VFKGTGSLCQYVAVEPALIAPKPANITHDEGASFPLAGLTAYYALVRQAALMQGNGKRVLINGGSGGVGAWAIQVRMITKRVSLPQSDADRPRCGLATRLYFRSQNRKART
jgi:NADPH:quinone reductase-like Zn-dependent oxidoreductase